VGRGVCVGVGVGVRTVGPACVCLQCTRSL